MHTNEKADRVIWQVTDTTGIPILGRTQAKLMNYISYPEIHAPQQQQSSVSQDSIKSTVPKFDRKFDWLKFGQTVQTAQSKDSLQTEPKFDRSNSTDQSKVDQTAQEEHRGMTEAKSGAAHEPKCPQVSWCKNSITIDEKTHPLPTTKECILHEYADVFKGIGTLPGGPYHIKLKGSYKPVQHLLRSVPLGMQSAYRAELDRLVKEGIIMEVHEHTEWINSIVPVMKDDGSLRLCLDPKDLKQLKGTSGMPEL